MFLVFSASPKNGPVTDRPAAAPELPGGGAAGTRHRHSNAQGNVIATLKVMP